MSNRNNNKSGNNIRLVNENELLQQLSCQPIDQESLNLFDELSRQIDAFVGPSSGNQSRPISYWLSNRQQQIAAGPSESSSMIKIIDIQKSKRKQLDEANWNQDTGTELRSWTRAGTNKKEETAQSTAGTSLEAGCNQDNSLDSNRCHNDPVIVDNQTNRQQLTSGVDTLSSCESDYDLLVYLGETETEDIVDTERSLDYQDQTWRQSICGGASLAPTIGEDSLSDLFPNNGLNSSNSNYIIDSPRPDDNQKNIVDDLTNDTPTPTADNNTFKPSFFINQSAQLDSASDPSIVQHQLSLGEKPPSESIRSIEATDATTSQASSLPDQPQTKRNILSEEKQQQQSNNQESYSSKITQHNIGNELLSSLLGIKSSSSNRSQEAEMSGIPRSGQSIGLSTTIANDDSMELDRLLAEMNESLDLNSLARYDPLAGRQPSYHHSPYYSQQDQRKQRSQTLNPRANSHQQTLLPLTTSREQVSLAATTTTTTHRTSSPRVQDRDQSSKSYSLANVSSNDNDGQNRDKLLKSFLLSASNSNNQVTASESSILDEYDGASRMLEQMISDQLREDKTADIRGDHQRHKSQRLPLDNLELTTERQKAPQVDNTKLRQHHLANRLMANETNRQQQVKQPIIVDNSASVMDNNARDTVGKSAASQKEQIIRPGLDGKVTDSIKQTLDKSSPVEDDRSASGQISLFHPRGQLSQHQQKPAEIRQIHSSSFDQSMASSKILTPEQARQSFDLTESIDRPPTPPEVDYDIDNDKTTVIRLEAAEFPPDFDTSDDDYGGVDEGKAKKKARHNEDEGNQMNRMKRRTLSSMRSMRNKFNDLFITSNNESASERRKKQQLVKSQKTGPKPPKRSSSIGSQSSAQSRHASLNRMSKQEVGQVRPSSPRESRSRWRQSAKGDDDAKQTLGQQLRERFSRSKSRLSKFLRSSSRSRAQSESKDIDQPETQIVDSELFEPSDIARNSDGIQREDSFDKSLDRHLAADLGTKKKASGSSSSSSSSSDLSGLDISRSRPRSRTRRPRGNDNQSERDKSKEKRASSLISLKRFGYAKIKKTPDTEDFDSMQIKTSSELPRAMSRKRGASRNKTRSPDAETMNGAGPSNETSEGNSPVIPINLGNHTRSLFTTNEHFGKNAPLKASNQNKRSARSLGREIRGEPFVETDKKESAKDSQHRKKPNRSQSMKSMSGNSKDIDDKESMDQSSDNINQANRTVSFSNLQNRRLPLTTNSFRPSSVCANKPELASADDKPLNKDGISSRARTVTPIGLSSDPLVGRRLESTKPAQLEPNRSRLTPIRAKGAAMIDDIKSKYSELFRSAGGSSSSSMARGRQQAGQVNRTASPDAPVAPVRPPRRRADQQQHQQRSKSVSSHLADPVEGNDRPIIQTSTTMLAPDHSLGRRDELDATRKSNQRQVSDKLASLAQHIKHSAVDFFHPEGIKRKNVPNNQTNEPLKGIKSDTEWRPVIGISSKSSRSLNTAGKVNDDDDDGVLLPESPPPPPSRQPVEGPMPIVSTTKNHTQQQQVSLDTDSTWESSGDEDADSSDDISEQKAIVQDQTEGLSKIARDESSSFKVVEPKTTPTTTADGKLLVACALGSNKPNDGIKEEKVAVGFDKMKLIQHQQQQIEKQDRINENNNNNISHHQQLLN